MPPSSPSLALSTRLRDATREAHMRAERSGIMHRVLRGQIDRDAYLPLLVALTTIYEALETELDRNAADPVIAPFDFAALRRLPSLQADLAALVGPDDTAPEPTPAARGYAGRLRTLGRGYGALLVSHAYTRYLGDLSGGQILGGIVDRALGLGGGPGTSFYDFSALGDGTAVKQRFRATLDALVIPDGLADSIVGEASTAFEMHEKLFVELDA